MNKFAFDVNFINQFWSNSGNRKKLYLILKNLHFFYDVIIKYAKSKINEAVSKQRVNKIFKSC